MRQNLEIGLFASWVESWIWNAPDRALELVSPFNWIPDIEANVKLASIQGTFMIISELANSSIGRILRQTELISRRVHWASPGGCSCEVRRIGWSQGRLAKIRSLEFWIFSVSWVVLVGIFPPMGVSLKICIILIGWMKKGLGQWQ